MRRLRRRNPRRVTPSRRRLPLLVSATALTTAFLAAAGLGPSPGRPTVGAAASQSRPNVIVIETDDQAVDEMKFMPNVNSLIADRGAAFDHNFVNYSLCCPSRSTFLTGEYAHHHGVMSNTFPSGGFGRFEPKYGDNNLAVWLERAGYHTALIGKYLNGYGNTNSGQAALVPPGWSEWYAGTASTTQSAYDYTLNENGTLVDYGANPADFKQDVFTQKAVDFVDRIAPGRAPFFLWLTYTAPHSGGPNPNPQPPSDCDNTAKPAPRHADALDTEPLPMPPSFNEADVSDKPAFIQALPRLTSSQIANITRMYRCRAESLLSVDEGVQRIIAALRSTGALPNTYVIFTSDNGFFQGEHRIPTGKTHVYEPSIRVPLVMRGPGIPHRVRVRDLSINADLAPTIAKITGATPHLTMDGRSLLPFAAHPTVERGRELEIEDLNFDAIRTQRYIYVKYKTGEEELYDLKRDPNELLNRSGDPAYAKVRSALAKRLRGLKDCKGDRCRLHPRLRLVTRSATERRHGHRCAVKPVIAEVRGTDAPDVAKAEFYVDGERVSVDSKPPLRRKLSLHGASGRTKLRLRATMIDGRRMTIDQHLRVCG